MKYIIAKTKIGALTFEIPIIFPENLAHSQVAEAIMQAIPGNEKRIVAAGSFNSMDMAAITCGGTSVSLKIHSRGSEDTLMIINNDYSHGIVDE